MATKTKKLPESWEEFCEQTERDPKALPDVSAYDDRDKKNAIANFKLPLIIRYCNGKEVKADEVRYEPWWIVEEDKNHPSGLGLSCDGCVHWYANADCGPRFAFVAVPILKHVVKYFIDLYRDLYL